MYKLNFKILERENNLNKIKHNVTLRFEKLKLVTILSAVELTIDTAGRCGNHDFPRIQPNKLSRSSIYLFRTPYRL